MTFKVEMTCDNVAFGETFEDAYNEITAVLRQLANTIDDADLTTRTFRIRDTNGNPIGNAYAVL